MQKSPIEAAPIRLKPQRRSADTIRVACLGNSIGSAATTMGNKNASIRGSTACIDGRPLGVSLAIMDAGVPSDNATTTAEETVAAIVRQHETTDRIPPIRYSREFPPSRRCGSCIVPEAKSYPQSHRTAVPGFSSLHAGQVAVVRICISYSRYPHQCTPGCGLECPTPGQCRESLRTSLSKLGRGTAA